MGDYFRQFISYKVKEDLTVQKEFISFFYAKGMTKVVAYENKKLIQSVITCIKQQPLPKELLIILQNMCHQLLQQSPTIRFNGRIAKRKGRACFNINISLVDENTIAQLNRNFYKKELTPTDILTFPYFDEHLFGDIFINPTMSYKKALSRKEDYSTYLKRLVIHGTLHLFLGKHSDLFDDIEEKLLKSCK